MCIVSGQLNLILYEKLGMKALVIYCQIITVIAGTFIVLVQEKLIKFSSVDSETLFVNIAIPGAIVLMSLSIQVGYTSIF